MSREMW